METNNNIDNDHLSLSSLSIIVSELSHLLIEFHRESKGQFLSPQNYRNWQDRIKSIFFLVAVQKCNNINKHWNRMNNTNRLEQLFGIISSMEGGDMNS